MLDEGLTWIPIYGWCSRRSLLTLGESTNDAQGRILWRSRRGPRSHESSMLTLEEGPREVQGRAHWHLRKDPWLDGGQSLGRAPWPLIVSLGRLTIAPGRDPKRSVLMLNEGALWRSRQDLIKLKNGDVMSEEGHHGAQRKKVMNLESCVGTWVSACKDM